MNQKFRLSILNLTFLSHNEISEIKGRTFESLTHLGILNLDGNKIQELRNYAFDGLKSCYRINLRDNMIKLVFNPQAPVAQKIADEVVF